MTLADGGWLLDVNALIALTDDRHPHHGLVTEWFVGSGSANWGTCLLTEAGFIRVTVNPRAGRHSVSQANDVLKLLAQHEGHRFWPMLSDWRTLIRPFADSIFGHQQVTDACLLGLAVQEGGVLVTIDKGIRFLAGRQYSGNLLVLELRESDGF